MTRIVSRRFWVAALAAPSLLVLAARAEENIITKTIPTKPGQKLTMNVDRGDIEIRTHSADNVDIKVVRELPKISLGKSQDIFTKHSVEISEASDGVRIKAEMPRKLLSGWFNPANRLSVHYTITVPERYDLDVSTAGGNVSVGAIEGQAKCRTSGGDIKLGAIRGGVNARTSGGNVTLAGATGDSNLHTSGGDIDVSTVTGNVTARTSGGTIEITRVSGTVIADTSGGDIHVKEAIGPVTAHTSGGTVTAQLTESPKAQSSFKTSGGDVNVTLPANVAVDLAARTSGGDVGSDFPGDYNKEKNRYTAKLNGGGPGMVLETSGGSIHVRRR
jgi:DUF4097 and DUF4098 domain-containing protein YvlB